MIQEELGELTKRPMQWVQVLEVAQLEAHIPSARGYPGRPTECRVAMARAFTAKAVYNMSTTRMLLGRLESDPSMRRICVWERKSDVPSEAILSRAFDEADGGIPISCLLTPVSLHDSQAVMPRVEISHDRVSNLYDLMDVAYDTPQIEDLSKGLGHVPTIDTNPRSKVKKEALEAETRRRKRVNCVTAEDQRYNERSTIERVNG